MAKQLKSAFTSAFTIVEMLMVIFIVAVLGKGALTAFVDFRQDAKIASLNYNINTMYYGVRDQWNRIQEKCHSVNREARGIPAWLPTIMTLNDATATFGAQKVACLKSEIPNEIERRFFDLASAGKAFDRLGFNKAVQYSNVPENPFIDPKATANINSIWGIGWVGVQPEGGPVAKSTADEVCNLVEVNKLFGWQAHWIVDYFDGSIHPGTNTPGIRECAMGNY
jgi:type II secretory pathway pseudopilin PulG